MAALDPSELERHVDSVHSVGQALGKGMYPDATKQLIYEQIALWLHRSAARLVHERVRILAEWRRRKTRPGEVAPLPHDVLQMIAARLIAGCAAVPAASTVRSLIDQAPTLFSTDRRLRDQAIFDHFFPQ
jgi:hypothetical protein